MTALSPRLRRTVVALGATGLSAALWTVAPVSAAPTGASVQGRVVGLDPRTGVVAVDVGGPQPNVALVRAGDADLTGAASLDAVPDGWTFEADTTSKDVDGIEVRTASAVRVSAPTANEGPKPKPPEEPKPAESADDGGH